MAAEPSKTIVFAGAGNVGLQAVLALALVMRALPEALWLCFVVDFDRLQEKDSRKGYPAHLTGMYKAEAAVEVVRMLCGSETAERFVPVVAAAQSTPGLFRGAAAVFNGTDSNLDAAWVSEESRNTWEVRMTTGIFGNKTSVHSLEVLPEGYTLGDVSYDNRAWSDTARYECRFGVPVNTFAGVVQPFGNVVGALAVQLFLACEDRSNARYRMIRICGEEILQSQGANASRRSLRRSEEIPISYDAGFGRLWSEVAVRLRVDVSDLLLEFSVSIVTRWCGKACARPYRGFERQPASGLCNVCGEKTFCLASAREVTLEEVEDISEQSLRRLHAPAGLRFTAHTRDGREADFCLPFRLEDVPALPALNGCDTPPAGR